MYYRNLIAGLTLAVALPAMAFAFPTTPPQPVDVAQAEPTEGDAMAPAGGDFPTDIMAGVFTADQAAAGVEIFGNSCAGCHGANMRGTPGGPGLVGVRFDLRWTREENSLGDMFTYIKENMPAGAPGSLSDVQYAQVMAHILEMHGYPAGDVELPTDVEVLGTVPVTELP